MLSLDVGFGSAGYTAVARGDVCLDIGVPTVLPPFFVRGDAYNLPFPSGFFDKVFFYDVIEHLVSPLKALKEINRVLKGDGELELSTPNPLHWRRFFRAMRGKDILLTPVPDHIAAWTDAEMRNILVRAGFRDIAFRFIIQKVTEMLDRRHMKYDKPLFSLLPIFRRVTGRNMLVNARKNYTVNYWKRKT